MERRKAISQTFGHKVHEGIEKFLTTGSFDEASEGLNNQQVSALSKLTDWCFKHDVQVEFSEEPLYSEEHGFAGTPDVIGTLDGKDGLAVIDWKTDSTPRSKADDLERSFKYQLQNAGYAILYEENFKKQVNLAWTIRSDKDGKFRVYEYPDLKEAKRMFLNLLEIHKSIKGK